MMGPKPCRPRSFSRSRRRSAAVLHFLRHPAEHGTQFLQAEGLGEIVVGADFHRLHGGLYRGVSGHHDYDGIRTPLPNQAQRLQTRCPGSFEIQQHGIDALGIEHLVGLLRVFGHEGVEPHGLRGLATSVPNGALVIHYQQVGNDFPQIARGSSRSTHFEILPLNYGFCAGSRQARSNPAPGATSAAGWPDHKFGVGMQMLKAPARRRPSGLQWELSSAWCAQCRPAEKVELRSPHRMVRESPASSCRAACGPLKRTL